MQRHGRSGSRPIELPQQRLSLLLSMVDRSPSLSTTAARSGQSRLNPAGTRIHSMFCPGCMLYEVVYGMSEHRLSPFVERFGEFVHQ